jgi:hypothetical protein
VIVVLPDDSSVAVNTLVTDPISKIVSAAGGDGPPAPAVPDPVTHVRSALSTPTTTPTCRLACRTSSSATSRSTSKADDPSDSARADGPAGTAARRRERPSHHC